MLYPSYVAWSLPLKGINDITQVVGKGTAQRLRVAFKRLSRSPYRFTIEKVDSAYLDKFVPLYEKDIKEKRGRARDVKGNTKKYMVNGEKCEAISLYKQKDFLGGVIYCYNDWSSSLDVTYQTLPHNIDILLPIGISHIGEHYILQRAVELKKLSISAGRDENPYGPLPHPSIGLAAYKLRMGYNPTSDASSGFKDTKDFSAISDALVFLESQHQVPITKAILFAGDEVSAKHNYTSLFGQNSVEIIVQPY